MGKVGVVGTFALTGTLVALSLPSKLTNVNLVTPPPETRGPTIFCFANTVILLRSWSSDVVGLRLLSAEFGIHEGGTW